jgi:polyphosphate kinase
MARTFFRRVEVLFPIEDPALRRWITGELFPMELQDNVNARVLHASGAYLPRPRAAEEPAFSVHDYFIASAAQRAATSDQPV